MKKLQNDFTTREQSKRLLELGVPANSANCCLRRILTDGGYCEVWIVDVFDFIGQIHDDYLPCWSGCRLMEIFDICNIYELHKFSTRDWSVNIKKLMRDYEVAAEENMLDFSKLEE